MRNLLPPAFALVVTLFGLSEARAIDPAFHLPLNEGAGETVQAPGNSGVEGRFIGVGGSWTNEVPDHFVSGSAYRSNGVGGTAIVISGARVPSLEILDNFTLTCWIRVRAAKNYSRIASKSDSEMEAFFDLRIDESSDGLSQIVLAQRAGTTGPGGYLEKAYETASEPTDLSSDWVFLAVVRDSVSGEVSFYQGSAADDTLASIGTTEGPEGSLQIGDKNLMIGNIAVNMDRAPDADFSDFRIYLEALTSDELEEVRQSAFER